MPTPFPSLPAMLLLLPLSGCLVFLDADDDAHPDDDAHADDDSTADDDVADDDTAADPCADAEPDDPCCAPPGPALYLCTGDFAPDALRGAFTRFDDEAVEFLDDEGVTWDFWKEGRVSDFPDLPDLTALGTVEVRQEGGCDGKGGFYASFAVSLEETPDVPLLVVGSRDWTAGEWSVTSPPDTTTCPGRPGDCWEFEHNKPVRFTRWDDGIELYQGGSGTIGAYHVSVGSAWSGSGDIECMDVGTDLLSWVLVVTPDL